MRQLLLRAFLPPWVTNARQAGSSPRPQLDQESCHSIVTIALASALAGNFGHWPLVDGAEEECHFRSSGMSHN